ncbi:MAG TPA: hypothetical protein VKT49_19960 [Bryobacteraceae bacterium]|nr:hypothetical protein [Bryobacteraceae bacterium]
MLSKCSINRQLLEDVAAKLKDIQELSKAQNDAVREGNAEAIEKLHPKMQTAFTAKQRAVDAWTRHHREHGC